MTDSGVSTRLEVLGGGAQTLAWSWSSDDPAVATVNGEGVVTGVSRGETIIRAAAPDGTALSCRVTVDRAGQNPIIPATWGLFIADGEPHVFDGRAYIYGSQDTPNGRTRDGFDWCSKTYHVIWSDDMIHWTDAGVSLDLDDIPDDVKGRGTRLWAPDCFRDPRTGRYCLMSCTNRGGIILSVSDSPTGPFTDHRSVTMNGERFTCIDPGVLTDGDRVYMVAPHFAVMQLDPDDLARVLPETYTPVMQWMDHDNDPFEGPSIRKYGDTYYYIYIKNHGHVADNGALPLYMGYMTAESPLGPYTDRGILVDTYDFPGAGNVHGSLIEWQGAYYLCHHIPFADLGLTRNMAIQPITRRVDGTFEEAVLTSSGFRGAFRAGDVVEAGSACAFSGGRNDRRCVSRTARDPEDDRIVTEITAGAYIVFRSVGESVTYRWADVGGGPVTVTLSVRTTSPGASLTLTADGRTAAVLPLPDTAGNWQTVTAPAALPAGRCALDFTLTAAPASGEAAMEWFRLDETEGK